MRKILFIDVDGTLLDKQKKVPSGIPNIFRKVKEAGNLIFLCSGRSYQGTKAFSYLEVDGQILFNGALIYIGDQEVFTQAIDAKTAECLLRKLKEADAGIHLLNKNQVYCDEKWNERRYVYLKSKGLSDEVIERKDQEEKDLKELRKDETVLKIDCRFKEEEKRQHFEESLPSSLCMSTDTGYYSRGGSYYAEITHHEANKGKAIEKVLSYYRIDKEDAYCFGDSDNDIPMFEACGHRIAMADGTDHLKKHADVITDTAENDGIRKAIIKFGLDR